MNNKLKEKVIKGGEKGGILHEKGEKLGVGLIFSLPQITSASLPIWLSADPALCWALPLTTAVTGSAPSCREKGTECMRFENFRGRRTEPTGGKPFETSILREAKQNLGGVRFCFKRCDLFCFFNYTC